MQYTDFAALQTPSPDRQALLEVIREALDAALEQDHRQIQAVLTYAQVQPTGTMDRPTVSRQISLPSSGADPEQAADLILDSFLNRAPGEGFQGKIRVEFLAEDEEGTYALGAYERLVQIGEPNHQLPGAGFGGHLPPPPPGMPPMPYGAYGGHNPRPHHHMPPMDPAYPGGGMPQMDDLSEEQHTVLLAGYAANERRLDMVLRQQQDLLDKYVEHHQHLIQFASYYMNQYQAPAQGGGGGGGGMDSPIAAIIGGLISMWMGGKGGGGQEAPPPPQPPPAPTYQRMPPMEDAFQPPPRDGAFDPSDITEDMANEWAAQNPDAAKRVARNLLPPAMQGLIPK